MKLCTLWFVLASATSSTAIASQTYLGSQALPGGWPTPLKGNVMEMQPMHFSTALQNEMMYLIDEQLVIDLETGVFDDWQLIADEVIAFASLPDVQGLDKAFVVTSAGPSAIQWDTTLSNPLVVTTLSGYIPDWEGVKKLWVQGRGQTQRIYGYDPGAGKLRRVDHTAGVWVTLPPLAVAGALRDLAFIEMDSSLPGEELVWLTKYNLTITSDDGATEASQVSATPSDSIGVLRGYQASAGNLLAWTHLVDGETVLDIWNENDSSATYALGSRDCTAILPRQNTMYGEHLLLTRGGLGDVDLVVVSAGSGANSVQLSRHASGDVFDTHAQSAQAPVELAVVGDFDMDGEDDLVVYAQATGGVAISHVRTTDVDEQTLIATGNAGIQLVPMGPNSKRFKVTLEVGTEVASQTIRAELWVVKDPSASNPVTERIVSDLVTLGSGELEHTFFLDFEFSGWDPLEANFYPSFVPCDVNGSGIVTGLYPGRFLGWAHATASTPVANEFPVWLNTSGPRPPAPTARPRGNR